MPDIIQPTVYSITGVIYDEFDNPLSNVMVKLYDRDLRSEQFLGEKSTGGKGDYKIQFNSRRAENPEHERVDIFIKVFDAAGVLLGESPIYFNVGRDTTINYKVGKTAYKGSSEFDVLLQKMRPIVEPQRVALGQLKEDGEYKDISFLAGELRESEERISLMNTAFKHSGSMHVAPDILYGLFRMSFPTDPKTLLQIKSESLLKALKQAIGENIISSRWSLELDGIVKTFNDLAAKQILNGSDLEPSVFKKLMDGVLTSDQQLIFANTYLANENEPGKFWEQLKHAPGYDDSTIGRIKQAMHLNLVTSNQPELTHALLRAQETDEELKVVHGYAKYNRQDWKNLVTQARISNFPAWVTGSSREEKIENYATNLEELHRELYPTTFFAQRLKNDSQSSFLLKDELITFFAGNPEFNLKSNHIHTEWETSSFAGIDNSKIENVKAELQVLNRLYKVSDEYKVVSELRSHNLHSATDIVTRYGEEQFKKQFVAAAGDASRAADIYARATSLSNKAHVLLVSAKMQSDIGIYAINGQKQPWEGYHEMFGDGETCECQHCQSVYSPSAYFVDILTFIKNENEEAYTELIRRRSDLDDILLTCKNTNTTIPYIDLVNEILEKEVTKRSGMPDPDGITNITHSYQTEGEAADLAALPEHISNTLYNGVTVGGTYTPSPLGAVGKNAVFSPYLPLDLSLEEIRLYAEKLGYKRYELMDSLYGNKLPGKLEDTNLAAEFFEFSQYELDIISAKIALQADLSGIDTVEKFLGLTKISYIDLLQLLESLFLNPFFAGARTVIIENIAPADPTTCNLSELKLSGADDAWLHKMIRFVRLRKKLNWDVFDLDRTMLTLLKTPNSTIVEFPATEADFNNKVLLPLFHIEYIRRQLHLPLSNCLLFFGDIETTRYLDHSKEDQAAIPSLYDQVFRNKTVSSLTNSPFKESGEGLSGDVASNREAFCAALGIDTLDFELLSVTGEQMSKASISRIFRQVMLAEILNISVKDLLIFISICDKKPDNNGTWTTKNLVEFLDDWKLLKSTGIAPLEFDSLVSTMIAPDYKLPVDDLLIGFIGGYQQGLEIILNDVSLTEPQRFSHFNTKRNELLQLWETNTSTITSVQNTTLTHADDLSIKKAIEAYIGESNQEMLGGLSQKDFLNGIALLKNSLSEYVLLKTTPLIFNRLDFDKVEIQWLTRQKEKTGINSLWNAGTATANGLYSAFQKLLYLSRVNKIKSRLASSSWMSLLDIAISNQGNAKLDFQQELINMYGIKDTELEILTGPGNDITIRGALNLVFPNDYFEDAASLLDLLEGCKKIATLGINKEQFEALLRTSTGSGDALTVRNHLKSKFSGKEWLEMIKPVTDHLRKRRRDALLAWLLSEPNTKWKDTNDVFDHFLIDVEMDPCMSSSRIKQAVGSIQLFIDRCLMNLEHWDNGDTDETNDPLILLGDKFAKQWNTWRKQYRVWEANRKVFLYPENWIEPELRDNKSPFFKELESQINQNEVTEELAKEVLHTYLEKLDGVANLEVVGLFNDEETNIVYVFGRTLNLPHQYFFRKQQQSCWTPWEKVDVDIEGDHILPVVWNGRLTLFWASFIEKQESNGGGTKISKPDANETMTMTSDQPVKYLELKLAWSEFKKGKWGPKKLARDLIKCPDQPADMTSAIQSGIAPSLYSLNSSFDEDKLLVHVFNVHTAYTPGKHYRVIKTFVFEACNSAPSLSDDYQNSAANYPSRMVHNKMFVEGMLDKLNPFSLFKTGTYIDNNSATANEIPILGKNPSRYQVLADHHEIQKDRPEIFSYKNRNHNFYVQSKETFDDFSLENAGLLMARRTVSPVNISTSVMNGSGGGTLSRSFPFASDVVNPGLMDSDNQIMEPIKVFKGKKYLFHTFYHPYVCSYLKRVSTKGIEALFTPEVQQVVSKELFSQASYDPQGNVLAPLPVEDLDFSFTGAYSSYNWELFFHIPLLIATRFSQNQKFEEARKWFHYIFDPTRSSVTIEGPERFWVTKPFKNEAIGATVPPADLLGNAVHSADLNAQLEYWEQNPFNPHAIARLRISAYMRTTVLKYIDNVVAWGDQLFKRDTLESINEATLLYMLASNILGRKKEKVPQRAIPVSQTFKTISENQLDRFRNAKVEIESFIAPSAPGEATENIRMPYFCLPKNDYLTKYWDTIADRLFKIRHCQNIEGAFRVLPLFEPPLDPGLLVRATAAGLDLSSILNDANTALPYYRFQVMLQKANELVNEVKSLGGSLLSALEKRDGEDMALLRSVHELKLFEKIREIKTKQRDEAEAMLTGIQSSKSVVEERLSYYNRNVAGNLNTSEKLYFDSSSKAIGIQRILEIRNYLVSVLHLIPDSKIGTPFTIGATYGGGNLGRAESAAINAMSSMSSFLRIEAELANMKGTYERRMEEWKFQAKTAELELKQLDQQMLTSEIRLAIAEKELENHDLQMQQSKEMDEYMRRKFSNTELYNWMSSQLSGLYFQSYQLAYSAAKKAEKCMQYELGLDKSEYIQYGYWDSLRKGLLSADKLQYDLRRLENAYLEENKREPEITKHISLNGLDPLAMINLRSTGSCQFEIPEIIYDMDHPGQYFRRIKAMSISVPCIAGPYTSVSAKLTQGANRYRKDKDFSGTIPYNEIPNNDDRFFYHTGTIDSIATSTGQNDSGIFELNFRDERYLPFEGTGAIGKWILEFPTVIKQFDYNTISDVILHVRYTARDGDSEFKHEVNRTLFERLNEIAQSMSEVGVHIPVNFRHDLSKEWHLLHKTGSAEMKIDKSRLPYFSISRDTKIESVLFIARLRAESPAFKISVANADLITITGEIEGLKIFKELTPTITLDNPFTLSVPQPELGNLEELMMVVKYRF